MIEEEYIEDVTNQFLQDWLNYNDDVLELKRTSGMEAKECTKIVSKYHPQFIVN